MSGTSKPKLLFITKILPQAETTGGHLYPYSILSHLAHVGFDVNVLLLEHWTVNGSIPVTTGIREGVPFQFIFPKYFSFGRWRWHPRGVLRSLHLKVSQRLRFVRAPRPIAEAKWWSEMSQDELDLVRLAAKNHNWAVVMCYTSFSAPALDLFGADVHKVVMAMDAFHTNEDPIFSGMTYEKEQDFLSKGDTVIAINEKETAIFSDMLPGKRVVCARTAYQPNFSSTPPMPGRLLFLGSRYPPNISGISWFIREVGPLLETLAPGHFSLSVVGDSGNFVEEKNHAFEVRIKGRVDDLEPEYRDAEIVIAPIFEGSGVSAKVIEAIAHGKAVVATRMGARGLEDLIGQPIVLADNPQDFAARLMELSFDSKQRSLLEDSARQTAAHKLSPEACYADLVASLMRCEAVPQNGASE